MWELQQTTDSRREPQIFADLPVTGSLKSPAFGMPVAIHCQVPLLSKQHVDSAQFLCNALLIRQDGSIERQPGMMSIASRGGVQVKDCLKLVPHIRKGNATGGGGDYGKLGTYPSLAEIFFCEKRRRHILSRRDAWLQPLQASSACWSPLVGLYEADYACLL